MAAGEMMRWPLELRSLASGTVVAGAVTSVEASDGSLRLLVDLPGGQGTVDVNDQTPNKAMTELRHEIENRGWLLCCNRCHREASTSAMAGGLSCYLGPPWRPLSTSTDLVASLGPASPASVVDAATAEEQAARPLPLLRRPIAWALMNTSPGGRFWARHTERKGEQHLEAYGSSDVWFEAVGVRRSSTEVGSVHRACYHNALSVFFAVAAIDGETVELRQFAFAVDDPVYTPATLFVVDNLLDGGFCMAVEHWKAGPFAVVDGLMDPLPTPAATSGELLTPTDLGPKAAEVLDVHPWLMRTT